MAGFPDAIRTTINGFGGLQKNQRHSGESDLPANHAGGEGLFRTVDAKA